MKLIRSLTRFALSLCLFANSSETFSQNCTSNAGLDQTLCVTQPLSLTGTPGSPQASTPAYAWTQVSGPSATITTPTTTGTSVTGLTPGNYVFQFSNKCADNLFATNLVSVTVLPEPPLALAGDDVANCSNVPVTLSANPVSPNFTGTWTVSPNTGTFSNINDPSAIFSPPAGSNTYTLTWTVSNGTCSTSDTKFVKVVQPVSPVSAGSTQTLNCNGNCVTLAGSSPGVAPPQSGFWSFVSGPSTPVFSNPNSATSTACNLVPGSYVFRWSVSGPCLTGSATVTINVTNINIAPNAGGTASYTTFCGSSSVTSQALSGSALAAGETGLWAQTGGGTAPYPNVTFTPNTTGSSVTVSGLTGTFPYVFTYKKTSASGCTNTATQTVYRSPGINNLSEPANIELACDVQTAAFSMTYDEVSGITNGLIRNCTRIAGPAAGTGTLGASTIAAGIRTDQWSVTGLTLAGTYIFRIEYRNSCGSVYRDISITVSRTPGTVNAGSSPTLPCNTLSANPIGSATAPTNLTWTQVSGPNTATLAGINTTSLMMTGLDAGVYLMRLSNSGGAGCQASTSDVLVKVTRAIPTVATTGANATICAGNYRLSANTPGPIETGTWTVSPSTGISFLPNANTPNAYVTGLATNTSYTFTWTVSNNCGSINSSQVNTTTASMAPPIPNAGSDVCRPAGTTSTPLNGNAPAGATIVWSALTPGSALSSTSTQSTNATFTGGSGEYLFSYSLSTPGCSTFIDTVAVTINSVIAAPNAGVNQDLCVATLPASTTLTATPSAPSGSIATWTQLSGPQVATISTPNNASTIISGLAAGVYEFEYRIKTGSCTDLFDVVAVRVAQEPTNANAGPDQSICNTTTSTQVTLAATPAIVGSGYWQVISGPPGTGLPTFSNVILATSTVNNLTQGSYLLRWTTINGPGCSAKTDDVVLNVSAAAFAGADVSLCDKSTTNLVGSANTSGTWTFVSGPGGSTVTTNSANTAVATGLTSSLTGSAYTFRYSIPVVGSCPASTDDVIITNFAAPSAADAGPDQEICFSTTSATLTGIAPAIGTATWVRISGPGTPTAGTANSSGIDTTLNNLTSPGIQVYEYRVNTNGACTASADRMQILKEVTANAGADQRWCNLATITLQGNAPIVNQGTWTNISGPSGFTIANANNPATSVSGMVPGTYIFAWTVLGPGGCTTNTDQVQIIIDASVAAVSAGSDQTFCEGTSAGLQLGSASQPGVTYTWSPTALLNNSTIAQPTFNGNNNAGVYTYTVKGANGACEKYDDVTIKVNPKPGANIYSGSNSCAATFSSTDLGNGVNGPVNYTWSFGTAGDATPNNGSGSGPINVSYRTAGSKSVSLNITSGDGCSNTGSLSYSVAPVCLLPVTLTDFSATWSGNHPALNWTVGVASNFSHFEIEKSMDGLNFDHSGEVNFYSSQNDYRFLDAGVDKTSSAQVYYRLKMIDHDGTFEYSAIRILSGESGFGITILPNPFISNLKVRLQNIPKPGIMHIRLFSSVGQLVMQQNYQLVRGDQTAEIDGANRLKPGIYSLELTVEGKSYLQRVLKHN